VVASGHAVSAAWTRGGGAAGASMARILATGTALPAYRLEAAAFSEALTRAFAPHFPDIRPLLRMAANCGVGARNIALPVDTILTPRTLSESSRCYADNAIALGTAAARQALARARLPSNAIDYVLTTSCTGYMLPSLDAHLVGRLGLRPDVRRLPITELGCLAGAAALARAADLLRSESNTAALVVAAELPSLTFQPGDGSMDNLVSSLVFGDGAGAAVLRAESGPGVEIVASRSLIVGGSLDEMGFDLRDGGFHVVLSKDVPRLLAGPLQTELTALLAAHQLTARDLGFACIHPGGPKILRAVDAALGVEGLTAASWRTLAEHGNQSSAAVLFILDRLLTDAPPRDGAYGLLAGFGPGLSIELSLLQWHA
jgi:alkylresorcinol/alkylpyrone synthase